MGTPEFWVALATIKKAHPWAFPVTHCGHLARFWQIGGDKEGCVFGSFSQSQLCNFQGSMKNENAGPCWEFRDGESSTLIYFLCGSFYVRGPWPHPRWHIHKADSVCSSEAQGSFPLNFYPFLTCWDKITMPSPGRAMDPEVKAMCLRWNRYPLSLD